MPNKPTTLREWEKEFDEKFPTRKPVIGDVVYFKRTVYADEVKSFIEDLLTSHNTELLRKIEGMKKKKSFIETEGISNDAYKHYSGIVDGFNQALDEVINIIKNR